MLPYPWELGAITTAHEPTGQIHSCAHPLISTSLWDAAGDGIYYTYYVHIYD